MEPPRTDSYAEEIINGTQASDTLWRADAARGLVAKLGSSAVGSGNCTAVPLADQWMLTAAHCFFDASRNLKVTPDLAVNGPAGWTGVWDGNNGLPPSGTNWVVVAHPTRDLALVRRWPRSAQDPALPTLVDDPTTSAKRLSPNDRIDSILGFGCTNYEKPNSGNSLNVFEGAMSVASSGIQSPVQGKITLASWTARLIPLPGSDTTTANYLGKGDSGGPARRTLTFDFDVLGEPAVLRNVLVGINYASEVPSGSAVDFSKCPHPTVGTTASSITTFDPSPASAPGTGKDVLPIDWFHIERTRLAKRSPTASLPPTPAGIPGTAFPPTGPDSFPYPNVAWVDIDGDGLHDAYSWGSSGLRALKNAANSTLGSQKTLLASLPPSLLGIPPVLGNFDGDNIADALVFSGSPAAPSLTFLPGADPFGPTPFGEPLPLSDFAAFFAPFLTAVEASGVPQPHVVPLAHANGESSLAILVDSVGPGGVVLPYNAIFLNALGTPALASVPNLRVGPRGFERNFTFDDIDGDGRLDLIVSAVAPGKGPARRTSKLTPSPTISRAPPS